jgi:hypothetical protein
MDDTAVTFEQERRIVAAVEQRAEKGFDDKDDSGGSLASQDLARSPRWARVGPGAVLATSGCGRDDRDIVYPDKKEIHRILPLNIHEHLRMIIV